MSKKIISIVVLVISFIGVKYGIEYYREQDAISGVNKSIEKLKIDAVKNHPDTQLSIAMQQEAISQAKVKLESESNEQKKLQTAASMFMGFYLINTKARLQFCSNQGVYIQLFVASFDNMHKHELKRAREIMSTTGITEDKFYSMLEPQMNKVLVQDMSDISTANNISTKDACTFINENADGLVEQMQISKTQPQVYQILN